jgi:flagellar biosynthetic protein FliR
LVAEFGTTAIAPMAIAALLIVTRIAALVFTAPVISSRHVPIPLRIALVVAMAVPVFVAIGASDMAVPTEPLAIGAALVQEVLIGAAMGLSAQAILAAAQLAGSLIESVAGMSFGAFDPAMAGGEAGGTAITRLFWWVTAAVFVASGGASAVAGGVLASFDTWPPGTEGLERGLLDFLVISIGGGFEFGLRAALPGLVAVITAAAIVAMVQRSCPSLGGMPVGLSLQSFAALLATSLVLLSAPWLINGGFEAIWPDLAGTVSRGGH